MKKNRYIFTSKYLVKRRRIGRVGEPGVSEFHFGHVKVEMPIRPSSRNVKEEVLCKIGIQGRGPGWRYKRAHL